MKNDGLNDSPAPLTESSKHRLDGMYQNYFLEYASYVILDRAVPYYQDGLKPVQRRILHSMWEKHDGRYHKVANLIGHTMQYHPHGDASIGDALVNIGQKGLLIDPQGNWGNVLTGDSAAAARYIEARLTPFALDVLFNAETTHWSLSYDGRANEPNFLPVKFPLLLAMGVEGIAVGLSTKILPHNPKELFEACIAYYRGKKMELYPDFPGGGVADCSNYQGGERGGKVKVRAVIEVVDKKTLSIKEIPFGTTTSSLMDSIVNANEKGKIKIRKVEDNTARDVDIIIHLPPGSDPHKVMAGLFAFTDCEVSLSPNCCVIVDKKPVFTDVQTVLKMSADHSQDLLKWELENELNDYENKWHMASLERIFIEHKVYLEIEKATSRENMLARILGGLKPYLKELRREVTQEEVAKLAEIPIRRISRFDTDKNKNLLVDLDEKIATVTDHLNNLTQYCIAWMQGILKKYGAEWERKTKLDSFSAVSAADVAVANLKFYVNRKEGFVGTSLKKEEFLFECSDMDEIIVILKDGQMLVTKVSDKTFVGKNIFYVDKFDRKDSRRVFNLVYLDVPTQISYVKRFLIGGVTRDKIYDLAPSSDKTLIQFLTSNSNGEAQVLEVLLKPRPRTKLNFEFDFSELEIKGRGVKGNTLTKHPIRKIKTLAEGESTLGSRKLYFHPLAALVNDDENGKLIGEFDKDDLVIVLRNNGKFQLFPLGGTIHLGPDIRYVGKYDSEKEFYALYFDKGNLCYYLKLFNISDVAVGREYLYISDEKSMLVLLSGLGDDQAFLVEYTGVSGRKREKELVSLEENSTLRSYKALGTRMTRMRQIHKLSKAPKEVLDGSVTLEQAFKKIENLPLDKMH